LQLNNILFLETNFYLTFFFYTGSLFLFVLKHPTSNLSQHVTIVFSSNKIILSSYFSLTTKNRFASILPGSPILTDLLPAGISALRDLGPVRIFTSKPGLKKNYIPREPITGNNIHDPCDFRKKSNKLASIISSLEGMKPALEDLIRDLNIPLRLGVVGAAINNLDIAAVAKRIRDLLNLILLL
jgi:hypothetical protein